jgi:hypothetical protein
MTSSITPPIFLGKFATVNDDRFDLGIAVSTTAHTPVANFDITNKMYVDDKINIQKLRIDAIETTINIDLPKIELLNSFINNLSEYDTSLTAIVTNIGTSLEGTKADLLTEVANRIQADSDILDALGAEYSDRQTAEAAILQNIATLKDKYDLYISTNNERSTAIENSVSNEAASRIASDNVINQTISDLNISTTNAILLAKTEAQNFAQQLNDAEVVARSNIDNTINTTIIGIQNNLSSETSARVSADTTLDAKIEKEIVDRGTATTSVSDNLAAEAVLRSQADTTLTTNLATESATRETNDNILQNNINIEATTRLNNYTQLETEIEALNVLVSQLQTNTDIASLSEKVNYLYQTFYRKDMQNAIGVNSDYQIVFQYGPGSI